MSNNSISTYKFKPFEFTVLKKNLDLQKRPLMALGFRVVCNNAYLYLFGDLYHQTQDDLGQRVPSTMQELWKYSFDLGEWKIIKCQNVPQELVLGSFTLSDNLIIKYGGTGATSGGFFFNRIYLGNLANEFKENGMIFEELEVSGDVPLPLYAQGNVMDGKYIYSIGGTSGYGYETDVHRFDLSTRKWELLHKSEGKNQDPETRFPHEVLFYKGRICMFTGKGSGTMNIFYGFSKVHMFDVATKQWQLLPAKHDHRVPFPGYPKNRRMNTCVQCPGKSNLVYLCGGHDGLGSFDDVWRIDLDTLQWEKLTNCIMPRPVYSHSAAITPSGRMYCYGGIVSGYDLDDEYTHITNDITSAWIKIPKLKDICWEAMVYYFKKQMFESSDEYLKKIGLPPEYYKRIIEARRIS